MKRLKIVRIAVSLIMFTTLSMVFLDYYRVTPSWLKITSTYLQLIPSMLSFTVAASFAGAGFIIVFLIAVFFGRVYCSFICPLGFFQDLFIRISRKLRKNGKYIYSAPHNILFYGILSLCAASFLIFGTTLILWIDPFSIFGRFMTYVASRMFFSINNLSASALIEKNIFAINSFSITPSSAGAIFSLPVFAVIMTISIFKGRLYCNSICPAGALLSLLSRISLFKISINKSSCIQCGRCESVCKSSCVNYRKLNVDFSRCVSCFNCISVCPNGSIGYTLRGSIKTGDNNADEKINKAAKTGNITRFSFISGLLLLPASLLAQKKEGVLYYQDSSKQVKFNRRHFSSPPGSSSIEAFNSRCTACSLCVSVCPTSVLQPAVMQYGLSGIMQPFMDFNSGYCNYDCVLCGDVCPAGAIQKKTVSDKKLIQTGKSFFIKENCIIYTNGTDCGACSEHCPTKAVHMIPFKNSLVIPEVNTEICTGCGACEHVCPVRPNKAIYVDGNPRHLAAKQPEIKEKKKIPNQGFPF